MVEQAMSTVVTVKQHPDQVPDTSARKRGLSAVREHEFQWLSHVVYMALSEAQSLMREAEKNEPVTSVELQDRQELLVEALACVATAEHYLRMLDNPPF